MWILGFKELAYQCMIVIGITDNHLRQRLLREPDLTLDSALKLGHAYEETKKHALELWRDYTQNPEIDQIYKFRKSYRFRNEIQILKSSWNANSVLEQIIRVFVQYTVKFAIIVEIRVILLNVALKRKAFIH